MKRILVIDREFGAGGSTIGQKLAHRLGWKLLDSALTDEIARLAKVTPEVCQRHEERVDPWLKRLTAIIWRGGYEQNLSTPDLSVLDTDRLVSLVRQVVLKAVEAGPCVIVGRGAPYFLRERTDTFCAFLYASRELRFQRVRQRVNTDEEAVHLVDTMDEERRKFVKYYFGHEWPNRHFFHVMLDMAIGDDSATEVILDLLQRTDRAAR